MDRTDSLLNQSVPALLGHWKWLHAHPELSGQESQTAAYVAEQLRRMGLEPRERVGGHGVVALIQGAPPGKCLALRADMDALPITEETGLSFSSTIPGVMHACGHDAHTAMLLCAAQVLQEQRDRLHGCVKLIFQPSEETSDNSGARRMIADGVLEHPHVDAILAQHVNPNRPTGTITLRSGAISAASDRFFITVRGKSCHASAPHNGVDAIVVGAQIITALQTLVSRTVNPVDSCVITIGKASGGTRYNVVADEFEVEGTCRNLSPAVRDAIPARMEQLIAGIAQGMGADYSFRYVRGYSPVINEPELTGLVHGTAAQLLGEANISADAASLGGEDFSFYAEQVPAVFYRLGCHKEGTPVFPTHSGHFVPDEAALSLGVRIMVACALRVLSSDPN